MTPKMTKTYPLYSWLKGQFASLVHDPPFVIAAGGIMDSGDISYMLSQQVDAVQLGTALLGCSESNASKIFSSPFARESTTKMVNIVSGRPARTILTPFIEKLLANFQGEELSPYGYIYNAFKQIRNKYPELANFILDKDFKVSNQKSQQTKKLQHWVRD
ncbi:AHL_G0031160.mRNA.1.CDS.1 [Saccharomyces cerevisiae]|nr:CPG_1a_G0031150.mRNA.1.CDS.1 [Saccharomyces cerevisiae]CAI4575909.1 AIE_G0031150.mRNA.1.CDS.1 [Saccharomyces cerevisiae]CAI4587144.1 AVB_G0031460.mRNA.1.CDS.1 [Saccharomyces cerevisiae]CAI4888280.1 AHL_G0031160.mRNA.1.CDS.1 [Saccharomyces cerevisiae]CAI6752867.1 AIE_G0031150.mRNA.1.CDS.1 [Saccharomyces cerevisiae]